MKLRQLKIQNIRNLEQIQFDCDSGIHFFYGRNAQGKTSILESISILSQLRSFRDHDLNPVLKENAHKGKVEGIFELEPNVQSSLKVELLALGSDHSVAQSRKIQKKAYINDKWIKSQVEYYGIKQKSSFIQFHSVILNPTSTDLLRMDPAYRRNYLNQAISSQNRLYLDLLRNYGQALEQKNALLKQERSLDEHLLTILNEKLALDGAKITRLRLEFLKNLAPDFEHYLNQFAPEQKKPVLGYFSRIFAEHGERKVDPEILYFNGHFELPTIEFLTELHHQQNKKLSHLERVRKVSLVGPHRDDFVLKNSNRDLVEVGSQGEVRSALLALKLSELEQFKSQTGIQPVLLIDDFSSELDRIRRGFLLEYFKDSDLQIFVTSTEKLITTGQVFQIEKGKLQPE